MAGMVEVLVCVMSVCVSNQAASKVTDKMYPVTRVTVQPVKELGHTQDLKGRFQFLYNLLLIFFLSLCPLNMSNLKLFPIKLLVLFFILSNAIEIFLKATMKDISNEESLVEVSE